MFAFVSAFPKSLHCTDETQQAETVLSAVLSIYIYIYIYKKKKQTLCVSGKYINKNGRAAGLELTTIAPSRTIVTDGNC